MMEERNPLLPIIEIVLLAGLPDPHLQDRHDVPAATRRRGRCGTCRRSTPAAPSRKTLRLVDDDRVGALAADVPHHSRQGVQRSAPSTSGRPADAISIDRRWRTSRTRSMRGLLRASAWSSSARICGTASRARFSRSASTIRRWTPRRADGRQGLRRRDRRRRSSSSRCGRTCARRGSAHEARRESPGRARSPTSGTGTSSR